VLAFHPMRSLRLPSRIRAFLLIGSLTLGALSGCAIGSEDIAHWKQTQKGPEKIVKVLTSERYPIELRAEAAFALIELDRTDVAGLHELGLALDQLSASEPEAVAAILRDLEPRVGAMIAGKEGEPATASQIRGKDAAFRLVGYADGAVKDKLVEHVVGFYVADFPGRSLAGDASAEQVAQKLGDPAVVRLVDAMSAKMPPEALVKLGELVASLGSAETKQKAGERLVAIEREMEGDDFVAWMKQEITAQQPAGAEPMDEARLAAMASLNREKFLNQGALAAMKPLAGEAVVASRLLEIAGAKPAADAPEVVVEVTNDRRKTALIALEGKTTPAQVDALLAIALDPEDALEVRDLAFDRVADTKSTDAIAKLWPLVQSAANQDLAKRLRWRAGELVLGLGGPAVVDEFLAKLPARAGVEFEPEELFGYATVIAGMDPVPLQAMRAALRGTWPRAVIVARVLADAGEAADRELLEQLAASKVAVSGKGWDRLEPEQKTVGDVANAASAKLGARLSGNSDEPSGS